VVDQVRRPLGHTAAAATWRDAGARLRWSTACFLRTATEHDESGLPAFVEQEFRDFL
jgi:hypothetical protein